MNSRILKTTYLTWPKFFNSPMKHTIIYHSSFCPLIVGGGVPAVTFLWLFFFNYSSQVLVWSSPFAVSLVVSIEGLGNECWLFYLVYAIHSHFYFFISSTKGIWFNYYQRSSSFILSDNHIWRIFLGYLLMKNRCVFLSAIARPMSPIHKAVLTLRCYLIFCVWSSSCRYMLWFLCFSRHPNAVYASVCQAWLYIIICAFKMVYNTS